jgi:hypothetical protein
MRWRIWVVAVFVATLLLTFLVFFSSTSAQDEDDDEAATATAVAAAEETAEAADDDASATETAEADAGTETPSPTDAPPAPTSQVTTIVEKVERGDPLQGDAMVVVIMSALVGAFVVLLLVLLLFSRALGSGKDIKEIVDLGRPPLEGITLVLIVVAVLILASGNRIDPQGTVGVLTAVVGYILGRAAGGGK